MEKPPEQRRLIACWTYKRHWRSYTAGKVYKKVLTRGDGK